MKNTELCHSRRPQKQHEKEDDDDQKPYLVQLPYHIIADISCKIPIKTLMKCRHVCKSLRSLFADPQFTEDLFSRTRPCHLVSSLNSDRYFFVDFNERRPNGVAALDLSIDSATPSSAIMVGSCKGLVCLYKMYCPYGFYICNPMTGESSSLPPPNREVDSSFLYWPLSLEEELTPVESTPTRHIEEILEPSFCGFGLGYSTISDVYKIVLIAYSRKMRMGIRPPGEIAYGPREVMVLTVDSGGWRHVGEFDMNNFDHVHGVYIHDCLHWTGLPVKGPRLIYAFDVGRECFRELPVPRWTSSESQMTRFNLGILNDCLSITVCWRASIHVWVMKHYGVEDSWTKELDISVEYGPSSFGGYAQILSFLPEWQVLLWQGRLQAHTAGSEGFVGLQVDGIPSSVDKAYPHVPSFISLKDVIRCQNPEGQGNVQTTAVDHGNAKEDKLNLQSNAHGLNQGNVQPVTVPVDQQQQGQLNVQSNAADHGNAEADKGNVQSNADQLDQGNLQSIAATITQKTQENRAPKKAKTTHEVQPMQASSSQPFYAWCPSQHSHLLCSYELCKPVRPSHNCDKDEDQVPCKEEESSSREVTDSPAKMKHFGCNFRYFEALGFCSLYNKSFYRNLVTDPSVLKLCK